MAESYLQIDQRCDRIEEAIKRLAQHLGHNLEIDRILQKEEKPKTEGE